MTRLTCYIFLGLLVAGPLHAQVHEHPLMQAGDTLYKSWDLLPQNVPMSVSRHSDFWDLSNLLAPYVHEIYVRPVPPRRELTVDAEMAYLDAFDVERFFDTKNNAVYLTGFGLTVFGNKHVTAECSPPILWRKAKVREDESWTYEGRVSFALRAAEKMPPSIQIGDSLRMVIELQYQTQMLGSGEVLTPTGLYNVIHGLTKITSGTTTEVYKNRAWHRVDMSIPVELPKDMSTGHIHTFLSASYPDPVAVVFTDEYDNLTAAEFRSSPRSGRVVRASPKVPDVFVYPNPSFGQVRFDFVNLSAGFYQIEVYNILGVKVYTEDLYINGTRTVPMDLSQLKKGTYIYRLVDGQKNALRSKRLVIIRP